MENKDNQTTRMTLRLEPADIEALKALQEATGLSRTGAIKHAIKVQTWKDQQTEERLSFIQKNINSYLEGSLGAAAARFEATAREIGAKSMSMEDLLEGISAIHKSFISFQDQSDTFLKKQSLMVSETQEFTARYNRQFQDFLVEAERRHEATKRGMENIEDVLKISEKLGKHAERLVVRTEKSLEHLDDYEKDLSSKIDKVIQNGMAKQTNKNKILFILILVALVAQIILTIYFMRQGIQNA